jgi:hypothetical protein
MKTIRIKYCFSLLLIISSIACEREVTDVKLPQFEQKLAITSFISPADTISYFFVSSNQRIFGELNSTEPMGNLTAFISDDSNEVELDSSRTGFKISKNKMPIKYGKTYKLQVLSDKGLAAEATCTVPAKKSFYLKADTFSVIRQYPGGPPGGASYRSLDAKVTFLDFPGEENYYRLLGKVTGYYSNPVHGTTWVSSNYVTYEKEYLVDTGMDGKEIVQRTINNLMHYTVSCDSAFVKIYLFNTEKNYYLYHKSLENYNNGENPFAEITPVFSNITSGLGIFAAYTVDSLVFRLK